MRQDFSAKSNRTYAAFGIEGPAPFSIEIDADAFVSQKGEVSAQITAFHDLLICEPPHPSAPHRFEAAGATGARSRRWQRLHRCRARRTVRYEITWNVAPYIGVNWERKLGQTASIANANGDPVSSLFFVGGVRLVW